MSVEYVENQTTVGEWADQTFGKADHPWRRPLRLLEEVAELCIVSGANRDEMVGRLAEVIEKNGLTHYGRRRLIDSSKVPEEIGDCRIVLNTISHEYGVDEDLERDRKMMINRGRTWNITAAGVGQHR
jgi:NTP pyrophosphatase (non-canonical NTP hydrolase)